MAPGVGNRRAASDRPVRPLIIAGMPRSGTTLLQHLCNAHPEMSVTNEFGNFAFLGSSYGAYALRALHRWHRVSGRWRFLGAADTDWRLNHRDNLRFVGTHLLQLARRRPFRIDVTHLTAAAAVGAPEARVIGDKLPRYIFSMKRFVSHPDLFRLVIYRDCRDVASSFLRKVRTDWRDMAWSRHLDNAEKIAGRWVTSIEEMEAHADGLFVMRYEALVDEPGTHLQRLGSWLDVDPSAFDQTRIRATSVGKYEAGLSAGEIDAVVGIAGPTMERLGYL